MFFFFKQKTAYEIREAVTVNILAVGIAGNQTPLVACAAKSQRRPVHLGCGVEDGAGENRNADFPAASGRPHLQFADFKIPYTRSVPAKARTQMSRFDSRSQ